MPPINSDRTLRTIREMLMGSSNEEICEVEIKLDWEVFSVVKSCFDSSVPNADENVWSPAKHLVLLQNSDADDELMATTCEEYLVRHWDKKLSQTLLELVGRFTNEALIGSTGVSRTQEPELRDFQVSYPAAAATAADAAIVLDPTSRILAVHEIVIPNKNRAFIEFLEQDVVIYFSSLRDALNAMDFIEAWDWFCKAVRQPLQNEAKHSDASYDFVMRDLANSKKDLLVSSRLSLSPSPEPERYCWRQLFQSCTSVSSKLAPRIEAFKGLEMTFEVMLSLAAAEFQLIFDGGVIFIGYRTVLYPTVIHRDSVQFHLLTTNEGQINPYKQTYESRILTEDSTQFKGKRCFLGWCTSAQVNLGTERLPMTVKWSCGDDKETSMQRDGHTITMQAGVSAPLSAVLGFQSIFKRSSCRLKFDPPRNYTQLLEDTARQVALLYDSSDRRCWLVPKLSLLLHMSQVYAWYRNRPRDRVPLVEPHSDASDLVGRLESLGGSIVSGNGEDVICFRQLMQWLNINLLEIPGVIKESGGQKLYGFEFMDIVAQPGRGSCMKRFSLESAGKAWIGIANVVDAVVVCAQLGDAITAADGAGTRSELCSKLPQGKDYLATTVGCLRRLIESKGGDLDDDLRASLLKISRESYWNLSKDPFSSCDPQSCSGECWQNADIFQHLISASPKLLDSRRILGRAQPEPARISIPVTGGVVFGTPPM